MHLVILQLKTAAPPRYSLLARTCGLKLSEASMASSVPVGPHAWLRVAARARRSVCEKGLSLPAAAAAAAAGRRLVGGTGGGSGSGSFSSETRPGDVWRH